MSAELFAKIRELSTSQIWDVLNPDKNDSYTLLFDKICTKTDLTLSTRDRDNIINGFLDETPIDVVKDHVLIIYEYIPNDVLFYHVCIVSWGQKYEKILEKFRHVIIINGIEEYVNSRENPNDNLSLSGHKQKLLDVTHGLFKSVNSTIYELQNFMQESFHSCTKMD